jgi:predicted P-loop ATPase
MNLKIGESRISISAEDCFKCGTYFFLSSSQAVSTPAGSEANSGASPCAAGAHAENRRRRRCFVLFDEKSVRRITLQICNDCAAPAEKTAARQNDSGSGSTDEAENLNKRGSW